MITVRTSTKRKHKKAPNRSYRVKIIITELKNILERFNSRLNEAE